MRSFWFGCLRLLCWILCRADAYLRVMPALPGLKSDDPFVDRQYEDEAVVSLASLE